MMKVLPSRDTDKVLPLLREEKRRSVALKPWWKFW